MRHLSGIKKIARPTDQRIALLKTMAKSLIEHGEITTTKAKAKALQSFTLKLVTLARKGDVGSMRQIRKYINSRDLIRKLTHEVVPKLNSKTGGEISVFNAGQRRGDGVGLAVIVFNMEE